MISIDLMIVNKLGLHARAAVKLANTANEFSCEILLTLHGKTVDCKSVMALMLLAAAKGTKFQLQCDGNDENEAHRAIVDLVNNRFEETE